MQFLFKPIMDILEQRGINNSCSYLSSSCNYELNCCQGSCEMCKNNLNNDLDSLFPSNEKIITHIFETQDVEYISKTGQSKVTSKLIRVEKKELLSAIFEQFNGQRSEYLVNRYQVSSDCYEWKNILHTTNNYGKIFHADYSENISGSPKDEPQSAYFSTEQYSLRCTVALTFEDDELENTYFYHLSDDRIHDSYFTSHVVEELIQHTQSEGEH